MTVIGATGSVGQPMSLLLKQNALISELALWGDARGGVAKIPGLAADLSHVNTPVKVFGYSGPGNLSAALQNADVVVIPAGVPRKKGDSFQDYKIRSNKYK